MLPRSLLAAVGIGAAFGMGMLAGGIGEARGSASSDDDVLAVARARAEALAQRQGEIMLACPVELLTPEAKEGARAPTAPASKSFALQVASLPQRSSADALAKKLAEQGLHARVVVGEVGGREVFRVRLRSFSERDEAETAKGKLAMPSFIVSE